MFLDCVCCQSADRLWRHVLNCAVAKILQRGTKYVPPETFTTVWKQFQLLNVVFCCSTRQ
jgi:hypothetical protein